MVMGRGQASELVRYTEVQVKAPGQQEGTQKRVQGLSLAQVAQLLPTRCQRLNAAVATRQNGLMK